MTKSRAERRYKDKCVVDNRFKLARHFDKCISDVPRGKFRKRAPFDCGKARCFICHSEKLLYKNSKFKGFRGESYESMGSIV